MNSPTPLILVADAIMFLHVLVVIFNVFGLVFIFVGNALTWSWVRNPWFRLLHLISISIVVVLAWLDSICPLTSIEMSLRNRAGDTTYTGTFISHWLESILYYEAPAWVFAIGYTIFGAIVVTSWFIVRPRGFSNN